MKLPDKLRIVKTAVDSITRHDDEPLEIRLFYLEKLQKHIHAEIESARKRETDAMAAQTPTPKSVQERATKK